MNIPQMADLPAAAPVSTYIPDYEGQLQRKQAIAATAGNTLATGANEFTKALADKKQKKEFAKKILTDLDAQAGLPEGQGQWWKKYNPDDPNLDLMSLGKAANAWGNYDLAYKQLEKRGGVTPNVLKPSEVPFDPRVDYVQLISQMKANHTEFKDKETSSAASSAVAAFKAYTADPANKLTNPTSQDAQQWILGRPEYQPFAANKEFHTMINNSFMDANKQAMGEYRNAQLPILQQNADANTARAEKTGTKATPPFDNTTASKNGKADALKDLTATTKIYNSQGAEGGSDADKRKIEVIKVAMEKMRGNKSLDYGDAILDAEKEVPPVVVAAVPEKTGLLQGVKNWAMNTPIVRTFTGAAQAPAAQTQPVPRMKGGSGPAAGF